MRLARERGRGVGWRRDLQIVRDNIPNSKNTLWATSCIRTFVVSSVSTAEGAKGFTRWVR